MVENRKFFG